jgi:hypothetical protein
MASLEPNPRNGARPFHISRNTRHADADSQRTRQLRSSRNNIPPSPSSFPRQRPIVPVLQRSPEGPTQYGATNRPHRRWHRHRRPSSRHRGTLCPRTPRSSLPQRLRRGGLITRHRALATSGPHRDSDTPELPLGGSCARSGDRCGQPPGTSRQDCLAGTRVRPGRRRSNGRELVGSRRRRRADLLPAGIASSRPATRPRA